MVPLPATGLDFIKEGRVRVTYEDYAAGSVGDSIIWIRGDVVE